MPLTLFTVNGTAAPNPYDPAQYPVQVARALLPSGEKIFADKLDGVATVPLINWVPIGYSALVYPMGKSVAEGIALLVAAIKNIGPGTSKALAGYSQGSIITSTVWRDYILNPSGTLHAYLNDFKGAVNWGNPMRAPGVCNGNTYAHWAPQSGGGISGTNDLTAAQTPSWWLDFANPNDLYTDSPVGTAAGKDEQLIYDMIVTENFGGTLKGLLALVESVAVQFLSPINEVIGIAIAVFNGLRFLTAGPGSGHYTYDIGPAISFLTQVAEASL